MSNAGFIKLNRGPDTDDLLRDPPALALMCQIAMRARRTEGYNVHGLEVGEALIGDYKKIGLSRRQYRTRLEKLAKAGFLTIKTTNKGTIARLTNTRVFDINADDNGQQNGQQAANKRPTDGQQAATNKNDKKEKNEIKREEPLSLEEARALYRDDPRFAHKDVDGSLSKKFKDGKLQFPSAIEVWLTRETKPKSGAAPKTKTASKQDPEGWEEWRDSEYPDADKSIPFAQVTREVQKEFENRGVS